MKINKQMLKLCLIVGERDCKFYSLFDIIRKAIKGGVTSIQLREKNFTEKELLTLTTSILKFLPQEFPMIINDFVEHVQWLRKKYPNVGLHIGQNDMPYLEARKLLGHEAIIGLSIENIEQAKKFRNCGADYFGIGPIFNTRSKTDAAPPIGETQLRTILNILSPTPCVAIGGITTNNARKIFQTGIDGIAVVSAITKAKDPEEAAKQLIDTGELNDNSEKEIYDSPYHCRI